MASTTALYTPEILALATSLARFPLTERLPHRGSARSPSCGSSLDIGLATHAHGRIEQVGLRSHACAIGQAAAAIFAAAAPGHDRAALAAAAQEIAAWLAGSALPSWPGFARIAPAAAYPARHGAILLPWKAALSALSSADAQR